MKNIGLFENNSKPMAHKYAEATAKIIIESGGQCCASKELVSTFSSELAEKVKQLPIAEFDKFADIVLSFGGDGTILSAARAFIGKNLPIMGINVGKLGFLAEFSAEEIEVSVNQLFNGNYRLVDRTAFETEINGHKHYALNDFVFEKTGSSRIITVSAYANGSLIAHYHADGLIVATPTGSTAYSLSCNGPIIVPNTEVMCLTPISPHTMTLRPLVLPDTVELKIVVNSHSGTANFSVDGQENYTIENGTEINIRRSEEKIKLVKPMDNLYYDLLRKKLLWSASAI